MHHNPRPSSVYRDIAILILLPTKCSCPSLRAALLALDAHEMCARRSKSALRYVAMYPSFTPWILGRGGVNLPTSTTSRPVGIVLSGALAEYWTRGLLNVVFCSLSPVGDFSFGSVDDPCFLLCWSCVAVHTAADQIT